LLRDLQLELKHRSIHVVGCDKAVKAFLAVIVCYVHINFRQKLFRHYCTREMEEADSSLVKEDIDTPACEGGDEAKQTLSKRQQKLLKKRQEWLSHSEERRCV
jgi:hypothetical protein